VNGVAFSKIALAMAAGLLLLAPAASADPVFNPDPLEFEDRLVGTTSTALDVAVTNDSATPYEVTDVFLDDETDFEIVSEDCSGTEITDTDGCTVSVRFTPMAAGDREAILVLDDGSPAPFGLLMGGFAYDPPTIDVAPTLLTFPATRRGSISLLPVSFTNTGDGAVTMGTASVPQASGFRLGVGDCALESLAPGESCEIQVEFAPDHVGTHGSSLTLSSNAAGTPHTVALSGVGLIDADVRLEPALLDFGLMAPPFATVTRELVVRNVGDTRARLAVRVPFVPSRAGRFTPVANNCLLRVITPGGSCKFIVSFLPERAGVLSGNVTVVSTGSPFLTAPPLASVPVSGEVRAAPIVVPALKASLADAVAKWRAASRAALRRRGFRLTGALPLSGRLTLKVFTVPRTPTSSFRRLIASGSERVSVAEKAKLTARTTRAGRRVLGQRRALRLRAVLKFRAPDGRSWGSSRRLRFPR